MIDLMKLPASEAERIAYAEGFTGTAELFKRIAELEAKRDELTGELEKARNQIPDPKQYAQDAQDAQDLEHLKQFFYDCFERLPGVYPCPEFSSDYDKSVIFDAIEKGAAE